LRACRWWKAICLVAWRWVWLTAAEWMRSGFLLVCPVKFEVKGLFLAQRSAMPSVCETRRLGDLWWSARIFATGASLLQGACLYFVGAPPSGRWVVVREEFATGASLLQGGVLVFCRSPALGAMGGGLQGPIAVGAPFPPKKRLCRHHRAGFTRTASSPVFARVPRAVTGIQCIVC
jgi:hypothetical protein